MDDRDEGQHPTEEHPTEEHTPPRRRRRPRRKGEAEPVPPRRRLGVSPELLGNAGPDELAAAEVRKVLARWAQARVQEQEARAWLERHGLEAQEVDGEPVVFTTSGRLEAVAELERNSSVPLGRRPVEEDTPQPGAAGESGEEDAGDILEEARRMQRRLRPRRRILPDFTAAERALATRLLGSEPALTIDRALAVARTALDFRGVPGTLTTAPAAALDSGPHYEPGELADESLASPAGPPELEESDLGVAEPDRILRLELRPGSVVVVETEETLHRERRKRYEEALGAGLPDYVSVVVLEAGLRIRAILEEPRDE